MIGICFISLALNYFKGLFIRRMKNFIALGSNDILQVSLLRILINKSGFA